MYILGIGVLTFSWDGLQRFPGLASYWDFDKVARSIFVSYARNDLQADELERFLTTLDRELRVQSGTPSSGLFRDSADVQLGEDWAATIEEALRNSLAMLAICSPSYLSSEYCGKEFGVFAERVRFAKQHAATAQLCPRAIFPVVWMYPESGLPVNVTELQYHNDGFPAAYKEHGLRQLFRLSRYEEDALATVTALATALIRSMTGPPLPALAELKPLKQLRNIFRSHPQLSQGVVSGAEFNGPNLVRIVVAAGKREELEQVRTFVSAYDSEAWSWRPYSPQSTVAIGAEAQIATGKTGLRCEFVEIDDEVCEKIKEAARRNEIVIVLADPWTLKLPTYAERLSPLDQLYLVNCALLVVWNNTDQETAQRTEELETGLRGVFATKITYPPPGHLFKGIDSHGELCRQLERALTEARLRIIETVPRARRVINQNLMSQAQQAGIDATSRATLQGPVGSKA
jgi:FxsC-like protein